MNWIARAAWRAIFRPRQFVRREIKKLLREIEAQRFQVLEIGSGDTRSRRASQSMLDLFPSTCEFTQSDVDPRHGHRIIDVYSLDISQEWDVIVLTSVLEHLTNPVRALDRCLEALKPGGILIVSVPFMYPLHDEPSDFWRLSPHMMRALLQDHGEIYIKVQGHAKIPIQVFAILKKSDEKPQVS